MRVWGRQRRGSKSKRLAGATRPGRRWLTWRRRRGGRRKLPTGRWPPCSPSLRPATFWKLPEAGATRREGIGGEARRGEEREGGGNWRGSGTVEGGIWKGGVAPPLGCGAGAGSRFLGAGRRGGGTGKATDGAVQLQRHGGPDTGVGGGFAGTRPETKFSGRGRLDFRKPGENFAAARAEDGRGRGPGLHLVLGHQGRKVSFSPSGKISPRGNDAAQPSRRRPNLGLLHLHEEPPSL